MARFQMADHVRGLLKQYGVESSIKEARGHTKVLFEVGEDKLIYTCGKSISDRRAQENASADIRRMLRDRGIALK